MAAWVAPAIMAGGQILSSFISSRNQGGGSGGPTPAQQVQASIDYDRARIPAVVEAAKKAGIHPHVALGASPGSFGGIASGGLYNPYQGDVKGDAIRALSGFAARAYENYQNQKQNIDVKKDLAELDGQQLYNENMVLRNKQIALDIARATSRTRLGQLNSRQDRVEMYELPDPTKNRYRDWLDGPKIVTDPAAITVDAYGNQWQHPEMTPAEWFEERYGDIGGELVGIPSFIDRVFSGMTPREYFNMEYE